MADKTTHFGLNLPLDTELADQIPLNENFSKLDEEVFKRGKAINGIEVNNDGDFILEEVPYARDIVTDHQQASSGEYLFRTTGGTASVSDGNAMLIGVHGRILHTGKTEETLNMTVHSEPREAQEGETPEGITATLNREVFIAKVENPATITVTLSYSNAWSENPTLYGVTVTGEPISGDYIIIQYVRADRGLITASYPTLFKSTGWNLYNNSTGYARVHKYSNQYDFMAGGTYTELKFSETIDGDRIPITVTSNHFSIPSDGYVWVSGGNALTTYILMTWSDWTSGPQGGWKAYSETSIDLSGVMEDYFPYGLCKIGAIIDEINVRDKTIIRRIERVAYSEDTIAQLKQAGTVYEADQNYIYYVLTTPVTASIEIDGAYVSNDHGLEIIESETDVAPFVQTLYGENLVDKLRTDIPNQLSALSEEATSIENGLAIVANGNTHAAIASGQYVYVKSHATLSAGMYTAKSAIAANAALSTSNLAAVSGGGLNALNSDMGKTNIYIDVSSQTYNSVAGATALFNALPTPFKGTCYATFTSGYNAVCLVNKQTATYGSIIYEVDWDTAPFYFVMKNGTASIDKLALNSNYVDISDSTPVNISNKTSEVGVSVNKGNFIAAVALDNEVICLPYYSSTYNKMYCALKDLNMANVTGTKNIRVYYRK